MKSILIIEDDKDQSEILREKLSLKYTVTIATSAIDALTHLQKEKPDIILLDVMLPGGMNGFDFIEKLKKDPQLTNIPILVLTNLDTEAETTRKIGVADYLIKANTSLDEIEKKVESILATPRDDRV